MAEKIDERWPSDNIKVLQRLSLDKMPEPGAQSAWDSTAVAKEQENRQEIEQVAMKIQAQQLSSAKTFTIA